MTKGISVSAYCRAEPARIGTILLALALATLAGAEAAPGFRAASGQNEGHLTAQTLRSQPESAAEWIIRDMERMPFEPAVTRAYASAAGGHASPSLTVRIPRVE